VDVTKWAFRTHGQRKVKSRFCRYAGSWSDVAADSVLVGYDTGSLGNPLLMLQDRCIIWEH
jgi:hypothetical protein